MPTDKSLPDSAIRHGPTRVHLSPRDTILLAIAMGLCGGYLDLIILVFRKYLWNDLRYYWSGSDFPWSVPVGHAILLSVPGMLVAFVNWARPGPITLRVGAWLFATLAIWAALLRMPFYGICTLILAAGLARPISAAVAIYIRRPRHARYALAGVFGALIILAGLSSGQRAVRKHLAASALPAARPGARNVLLIVWDTVRSPNLSLYGYRRNTSPNLMNWARKGVRYTLALAPAPWTYPSHSSFFTGQWPYNLNSQWNYALDANVPTLAEYLASKGYQTVAFAANTRCCSYETGLDRGFLHFEDYPLTPRFFFGRTVPGSWILKNIVSRGDFYDSKWIDLQSRDARGTNDAFLDWVQRSPRDRPFFAFLNYFDAHDPYVPPAGYVGRFGIRPKTDRDFQFLFDYRDVGNDRNRIRNIYMALDCYDDCIAFLDGELGRLLDALRGQGLLENTLVIITGDHGESFGDHSVFRHGSAIYLDQIAVPLVILSPNAPAGRSVGTPVSLRDLPATVVDQLGLSAGSPFPGHSLAAFWSLSPGQPAPKTTPALSELAHLNAFQPQPRNTLSRAGLQMSLVASGRHYIRDGTGSEQLYDLRRDPSELVNLMDSATGNEEVGAYRRLLLGVLTENPGSIEVENAYLRPYRQWLKTLVQSDSQPHRPATAVASH
jgi:arylsulfatase A-like enzyme